MIGALISAASSLIGGSMASNAQKEANAAMLADKEKDRALQKEFATTGIQWRVNDAKSAGLHPLAALGAAGASYTPSSLTFTPETGMADGIRSMGQDLGRAVNASQSQGQRNTMYTKAVETLSLEKMGLENQLLASQIARINSTQSPPMPVGDRYLIPGQSSTPVVTSLSAPSTLIDTNPMKRTASSPTAPHQEPGAINDAGYARTAGGLYPIPSTDIKERIEDNFWHETAHFARNNLLPMVSPKLHDPPYAPPEGKIWVFNPLYGYKLVKKHWANRFFASDLVK